MNVTHEQAIDTLARDQAASAIARWLDATGWPVRQMPVADKAAIRRRVEELWRDLAPTGTEAELAYDVVLGRTS